MEELSQEELDPLVEQATIDAYGDDEQLAGFPEPPPKGAEWIAAYRHWAGFA